MADSLASITRIFKLGRLAWAIGYHVGAPNGWEIATDIIIGWRPSVVAITVGWGFDSFAPLSPWPKVWVRRQSPKGHILTGGAWLGLFINVGS